MNYIGKDLDTVWTRIFYHVWWPGQGNDPMYLANTSMNQTRNNYYENNYTPHMFTNGKDSGSNTNNWKSDPRDYLDDIGLYTVNLSGNRSGNDISFDVHLNALKTTPNSKDLRLFVGAVMDTVKYPNSANGLSEHYDAVIELLTGDTGTRIELKSGVDKTESFTWTMRSEWINHPDISWKITGLKVVAWLQDYSSKEVLQVNVLEID
ncbi:MAG: hypothetical protein QF842_01525 [Candidatus Marinimicrobia bacterium]|nr:hypothetical protein [Candidatus Neomarinimicrobiota bacterium]MDP6612011.1 hypothetical protein [Candidatus Neomarinimicrobiota bacterium]